MNEDCISFEIAKLLKEKGFDSHYSTHFYKNNKAYKEMFNDIKCKLWKKKN